MSNITSAIKKAKEILEKNGRISDEEIIDISIELELNIQDADKFSQYVADKMRISNSTENKQPLQKKQAPRKTKHLKIKEMLDCKIVFPGDIIIAKGTNEKAVLCADGEVRFSGKKQSMNHWLKDVYNWEAVATYMYAVSEKTGRTLYEMSEDYLQNPEAYKHRYIDVLSTEFNDDEPRLFVEQDIFQEEKQLEEKHLSENEDNDDSAEILEEEIDYIDDGILFEFRLKTGKNNKKAKYEFAIAKENGFILYPDWEEKFNFSSVFEIEKIKFVTQVEDEIALDFNCDSRGYYDKEFSVLKYNRKIYGFIIEKRGNTVAEYIVKIKIKFFKRGINLKLINNQGKSESVKTICSFKCLDEELINKFKEYNKNELKFSVKNSLQKNSLIQEDSEYNNIKKQEDAKTFINIFGQLNIKYTDFLFGIDGIVPKNARIGIAIICISAIENRKKVIRLGEFGYKEKNILFRVYEDFCFDKISDKICIESMLYVAKSGIPELGEEFLANKSGYKLGVFDRQIRSSARNALINKKNNESLASIIFSVRKNEMYGQPLWNLKCNMSNPEEILFEEGVTLEINTAHSEYKFIADDRNILSRQLKIEILSNVITIIILKLKMQSEDWEKIMNVKNAKKGSISSVVRYFMNSMQLDLSVPENVSFSVRRFLESDFKRLKFRIL